MLLLTGASGYVGQHLMSALEGHSPSVPPSHFTVLPLYNSIKIQDGFQVDLTDPAQVASLFKKHAIDGVIHLAAESRPGLCEQKPGLGLLANTTATRNLLQAAAPRLPWFLYVSTDMVFSGETGGYSETATPSPINQYGISKALAEESVRHYPGTWAIVRPALIYGAPAGEKASMLSWTLNVLNGQDGSFFSDEFRTPVWVSDLVSLLLRLYNNKGTGVYHAGGPDRVSRAAFANMVADVWDIPRSNVKTSSLEVMPDSQWRPRDLSLHCDKAAELVAFTPLRTALTQIKQTSFL